MSDAMSMPAGDERKDRRITLLTASIGYVLVALDSSIVNVALDDVSQGLATDVAGLQWIVTAYIVAFASLVLSGGAFGDSYGARNVYLAGLWLFVAGSLVSSCARSVPELIAGRATQGTAAALLIPNALSLIRYAYREDAARAKAIASWVTAGSVAQVVGPLIGGGLLVFFDWRSIFLVNLPVCAAAIWFTSRTVYETDDRGSRRLDLPGQVSAAIFMIALIAGLIEARQAGLGSSRSLVALAIALPSALVFVIVERRSKHPMLPLFLFNERAFSLISIATLIGAAIFFGMLFVLNLYFLRVAGYTPLKTGMALLPLAVLATVGNLTSVKLAGSIVPLILMIVGAVFRFVGFVGLALTIADVSYLQIAVPLMLIGFGGGLSSPMAISMLLSAVDKRYTGVASGISTATSQLGASMGIAVFGAFLAGPQTMAEGTYLASLVSVALTMVMVLLFWRLRR